MDPNETLRLILASTDKDEAQEHCQNLADWLRSGGFKPTVPAGTLYWPGTGTRYAVLSPMSDNNYTWEFVLYGHDGSRTESWRLPVEGQ